MIKMKNVIFGAFCIFHVLSISAQNLILKGRVKEMSSGETPLENVYVKFKGANQKKSGHDGMFELVFPRRSPGDKTFLIKVIKPGYELVNGKDFENLSISNDGQLKPDIILAPEGMIEEMKKKYYDISDSTLSARFRREISQCKEQRMSSEISQQAFVAKMEQLERNFNEQASQLNKLADKFARTNIDDIGSLDRLAMGLFLNGEIVEAIQVLEGASYNSVTDSILKEEEKLQIIEDELRVRRHIVKERKKQRIDRIKQLISLNKVVFDLTKVAALYDELSRLSPDSISILTEAEKFYRENYFFSRAISINQKITESLESNPATVAHSYFSLGTLLSITGDAKNALTAFGAAADNYQWLVRLDSSKKNRWNLGLALEFKGNVHLAMGNTQEALECYLEKEKVAQSLLIAYPEDVKIKRGLAVAYEKLGFIYQTLGDTPKAFQYFEDETKIFEEFHATDSSNVLKKNGLTLCYDRIGEIHFLRGNLDLAEYYWCRQEKMVNEMVASTPHAPQVKHNLAIVYEKLAKLHRRLGCPAEALQYFEIETQIMEELCKSFPENIEYKHGLALCFAGLGAGHSDLGNFVVANGFFEQQKRISEELVLSHPENLTFLNSLAASCINLGHANQSLGYNEKALKFFENGNKLYKKLHLSSIRTMVYRDCYAESYFFLGKQFQLMGECDRAKKHFRKAKKIWEEMMENRFDYLEVEVRFAQIEEEISNL